MNQKLDSQISVLNHQISALNQKIDGFAIQLNGRLDATNQRIDKLFLLVLGTLAGSIGSLIGVVLTLVRLYS